MGPACATALTIVSACERRVAVKLSATTTVGVLPLFSALASDRERGKAIATRVTVARATTRAM
jgi:hypothetical protein